MLSHIMIGANDKSAAATFYEAALAPLGYAKAFDTDRYTGLSCGQEHPPVLVGAPFDDQPATCGNGSMLGFRADTRAKVREAYEAGLKAGGKDEGAPGPRPLGPPNTYAAYLRDPTGNKVGFFCMAEGE